MARYTVEVLTHLNRDIVVDAPDEDAACAEAERLMRLDLDMRGITTSVVAIEANSVAEVQA